MSQAELLNSVSKTQDRRLLSYLKGRFSPAQARSAMARYCSSEEKVRVLVAFSNPFQDALSTPLQSANLWLGSLPHLIHEAYTQLGMQSMRIDGVPTSNRLIDEIRDSIKTHAVFSS